MSQVIDLTEIVEKKIKDLPPLPLVVQKLMSALGDEMSSAEDVMQVLSSDQALAGKVLKLVNSSFYGLSGQVSTLSRAVVILGYSAIRNLAVGLNVAGYMASAGAKGDFDAFWDHAVANAAACRVVAAKVDYPDPEEAFIAGLLHDIGQFVLGLAVPKEYRQVQEGRPQDLLENEQKLLGVAHPKVGALMLKHWKLPRNLVDAARFHHNAQVFGKGEDPLVSIVALGDALANVHGHAHEGSLAGPDLVALVGALDFDVALTGEVLAEMDKQIEETRSFLQIATDTEVTGQAPESVEGSRAVVICTEPVKMTWTRQVLDHFGTDYVPMKSFFGGDHDVDCAILDAASISDEQLAKMAPVLQESGVPLYVLGEDSGGRVAALMGGAPDLLPVAFSRADLDLYE